MEDWKNVKDIGWKEDPLEKWMRSSKAVTTENEKGAEAMHTDGRSCFIILRRCEEIQDTDCKRLGFLNMEAVSFVWLFLSLCK